MQKKIYILRHGQTLFNKEQRLQGHCNSILTDKGEEQAKNIGDSLNKHIDKNIDWTLISSPLGRAMQTAEIVASRSSVDLKTIITEPRIKEFSFGSWETKSIPKILEENPTLIDRKDWYLQAPDAETFESVKERIINWLNDPLTADELIVVSHGLTGALLRGVLTGMNYDEIWAQDLPQDAYFYFADGKLDRINC